MGRSHGPHHLKSFKGQNGRDSMTGSKAPARTRKTIVRRMCITATNTGIRVFHTMIGELTGKGSGVVIR